MLRAGKISDKGIEQLAKYENGRSTIWHDVLKSHFDILNPELRIAALRSHNKASDSTAGSWLPADIAYSATDNSARIRTANLLGIPELKLRTMETPKKYRNAPVTRVTTVKTSNPNHVADVLRDERNLRSKGILKSLLRYTTTHPWSDKIKDPKKIRYSYWPASNAIVVPGGNANPITRHEVGHRAAHVLAHKNPLKLNVRTAKTVRALRKLDPDLMDMLSRLRPEHMDSIASEIQGHALATRAGHGGRRLREVTSFKGDNPIRSIFPYNRDTTRKLKEFAKHPAMIQNPEALSTLEHLVRNYKVPII